MTNFDDNLPQYILDFKTTNPKAYWHNIGDRDANAGLNSRESEVPEEYRRFYESGHRLRRDMVTDLRKMGLLAARQKDLWES